MSPSNKKNHGKAKKATSTPPRAPDITVPLNISSSAPATHVEFREFIELADFKSIKFFLATAASTSEGQNLEYLWDRAFEEGKQALLQTLDRKLDDADNRGYKRGFEEGESSKIKLFAMGLEEGRADERLEWIAEGHGELCFKPTPVIEDSGTQTDPQSPPIPPRGVSVQTDDPAPRPMAMTAVQADTPEPLPPRPRSTLKTADSTVQTTPLGIQHASSQTSPPHPSPAPDPIHTTSPPPTALSWADDAASLPISTLPISSPPIPLLPNLPSSPPPRNLSVLRSSTAKPFLSLQRRNNRSRAHFSQPLRNQQPFIPYHAFSRRRFPPPRAFSTPYRPDQVYPHHTPRFSLSSALNWEDDPRLFKLSQALNALGWVRP